MRAPGSAWWIGVGRDVQGPRRMSQGPEPSSKSIYLPSLAMYTNADPLHQNSCIIDLKTQSSIFDQRKLS